MASLYSNASVMSEASMVSVVTDIRRSTFFGGVDEGTGEAKLHFPFENVHLVPVGREYDMNSSVRVRGRHLDNDRHPLLSSGLHPQLQLGHLYKVAVDDEQFEEYHRVAEDASLGWMGTGEESLADRGLRCSCDCPNCATCAHKADSALPINYYCLAIEDNLYRRVVDEICAADRMPFGLFFCGHHEDVARPSICIPLTVLILLFGAMGYVAYRFQA